ncbi:unconventional myosin-X-like, partial [Mustelus asterias]
ILIGLPAFSRIFCFCINGDERKENTNKKRKFWKRFSQSGSINGSRVNFLSSMPERFDEGVVRNQLRYSGMLEMVKIRRAGFPVRRPFQEFYLRYKMLLKNRNIPEGGKERCIMLLKLYDDCNSHWRLGKSKVFLKEALEQKLERDRAEELQGAATVLQAHILGYRA